MATNPKSIPRVVTDDRNINQLQENIIAPLNFILSKKIISNNILTSIPLAIGTNTINHLLSRELIGWFIVRQRSAANIYDDQDNNDNTSVSLLLVSDAAVTVDLVVF